MCHPGRQVGDPKLERRIGSSLINAGGSVSLMLKMGASGWARDRLRQHLLAAELREEVLEVKAGQSGAGCGRPARRHVEVGLCQVAADRFTSPSSKELDGPQLHPATREALGTSHPKRVPSDGSAAIGGSDLAAHAKGRLLEGVHEILLRRCQPVDAWEERKVVVRDTLGPAAWKLPLKERLLVR